MGLFISFEGGEGAGKSTQARLLAERLRQEGHRAELVHEPGGTELGEQLRGWLKATDKPLTFEAELFLFVAARAEVVRRVVRPALDAGAVVVADRYADSTTAYQGSGRKLPMRHVRSANELATGGLWPDLTFLLDLPPEVGLDRAQAAPLDGRHDGRGGDAGARRFEGASVEFHRRVRQGFLKLAEASPARWDVLDATEAADALHARVWARAAPLLSAPLGAVSSSPSTGRLPGM